MSIGWEAFHTAVATARAEMTALAPDAETRAEGEAYIARVAATSLNDAFLGHHFSAHGLTRALPTRGGPNPDYIMHHAAISKRTRRDAHAFGRRFKA